MSIPHKCPVCLGACGFQSEPSSEVTSAFTAWNPCRACGGTGIVWERTAIHFCPSCGFPLGTHNQWCLYNFSLNEVPKFTLQYTQ